MAAPAHNISLLRFGIFELDLQTGELRKGGRKIRLRPQAAKVLAVLTAHAGELVTREQLREEIWGQEIFVDFEHGLNLCIGEIRSALSDDAETPRYIETLPRRGYRFIAPMEPAVPLSAAQSMPTLETTAQATAEVARPESKSKRKAGAITIAALVVLALAALAWRVSLRPRIASAHISSLAVLPLENLSKDPEQEYFADGMTDELITSLAKIGSLRVISRNSVMPYKGKYKSVAQIGRELNVDAVIEGTVVRSGNRVRITAQLIETRKDRHLWAQAYEGDVRDILKLQEQVAQAIATEIKGKLAPEEQVHLRTAREVNPDAHEADLRGFYELHKHGAAGSFLPAGNEIEKALKLFQQALSIDPSDALAYAGLAD